MNEPQIDRVPREPQIRITFNPEFVETCHRFNLAIGQAAIAAGAELARELARSIRQP